MFDKITFCQNCLMPSSRPRIKFESKICNACINNQKKQKIDWGKRREDFLKIVRENSTEKNQYDCIVPWSGGKDSSMIAYRLKFEFNLNPLLVTFAPLIPTDVGEHNRNQLINKGFDNILVNPNQNVSRLISKRFFEERGDPKIGWSAGVTATPIMLAVKMNIPLVIYAEHGESEYGGHVLSENHTKQRDINEFLEHLVGDNPLNWVDGESINENDLIPYTFSDLESVKKIGVKALYFSYFFKWDVYDNYNFIKNKIDFKLNPNGRTDGTFTNYDSLDDKIDDIYYYMQFIKFGFGRCLRDASRLIQLGYISKKKALEYIRQYDNEFPSSYINDVLEYFKFSKKNLNEIIDKHRNPEIWTKKNGVWKLNIENYLDG